MSYGRGYDEQRYSPLTQINTNNVDELGLAWSFEIPEQGGVEATPLIIGGTMYVTSAWSVVYALDASNGKLLWRYDPKTPKKWLVKTCCGPHNRGVAFWENKVFVATLDGRLLALNAKTGELIWETQTTDRNESYSITGAPRVAKGKVFIGNSGAEFGVRGYVSAYDVEDGSMSWRFYTVPDPRSEGSSPAMQMARKTWTEGSWYESGGGGTVWDSIVYDADLDQLYIGVGNGSPWNKQIRSPGDGDNLFLSSIVALNPDTGEYIWHYQTTPGESWDYTASQSIILAEFVIEGVTRKALMQAPKNGFFYVLDRHDGKLISAEPFVYVNWAKGIDKETGRPIESSHARYKGHSSLIYPSSWGGHLWNPMSFSPKTQLAYLPSLDTGQVYKHDSNYSRNPIGLNLGTDGGAAGDFESAAVAPHLPEDEQRTRASSGSLLAWNPVTQEKAWEVKQDYLYSGGTMTTAGDLVFQGNFEGDFTAYSADKGTKLWSSKGHASIFAGPVSYMVDGEQYVSIASARGSLVGLIGGFEMDELDIPKENRILTFKLNGKGKIVNKPLMKKPEPQPIDLPADAKNEVISQGAQLYGHFCFACHGPNGVSAGLFPDLRYADKNTHELWVPIVLGGIYQDRGMVGFHEVLDVDDAEAIRLYILTLASHLDN